MSRCLSAAVVLLAITETALAAKPHYELAGRVVAIADGDTLTILDGSNTQHKIRLAGIDAPKKAKRSGPRLERISPAKCSGR